MASVAVEKPPEGVDLSNLFDDTKSDSLPFKIEVLEDNSASTSQEAESSQNEMEPLLLGTKEEELDLKPELDPSDHLSDSITQNPDDEHVPSGLECSICQAVLSSDRTLAEHMRFHTGERYSCSECSATFISLEKLHRHRYSYHSKRRRLETVECTVCQRKFANQKNLTAHMRLHTGESPFSCEECDESFISEYRLRRHKTKIHLGERPDPVECPICYKILSNKQSFRIHMRMHDGERPFACKDCGATFTTSQNYQRHVVGHTGERPFGCEECGKVYRTSSDLAIHKKRKHSGENTKDPVKLEPELKAPFGISNDSATVPKDSPTGVTCDICLRLLANQRTLIEHMRIHTGERPFSCDDCGTSYPSNDSLNRHRRTRHSVLAPPQPLECSICQKELANRRTLKLHMRTHTGERPYSCTECDEMFISQQHQQNHFKRRHMGEQEPAIRVECSVCQKEVTKRRLEEHMRIHTGERPFPCIDCDVSFTTYDNLRHHLKSQSHFDHRSDRITCPVCNEDFASKSALRIHRKVHNEESEHICKECGNRLSSKKALARHMMIHTGERIHVCEECGKAYRDAQSLKFHKMKHTGERPHVCDQCGAGFMSNAGLNGHLRSVHSELMSVEKAEDGSISQETTHESIFDSTIKPDPKPPAIILNHCITEDETKTSRLSDLENSGTSGSPPAVPEGPLPEAKREESDRLVMFGDFVSYEEEAQPSGVVELPVRENLTVNERKRKRPSEFDEVVQFSGVSDFLEPVPQEEMEPLLPEAKEENHLDFASTTQEVTPKLEEPDEFPIEIKEEETDGVVELPARESITCPVCNEVFASKFALRIHGKVHKEIIEPFCKKCGKHLSSKKSLGRHAKTCDGKRVHVCEECGKVFSSAQTLTFHKVKHTRVRPHVCDQCGAGFMSNAGLDGHLRSVHSELVSVERADDDSASQETTKESIFESAIKPDPKPPAIIMNHCITEDETKTSRLSDLENSGDSGSPPAVPEGPLLEAKREETGRLVMFGDFVSYEEEAQPSGVVELPVREKITVNERKRKRPSEFDEVGEFGVVSDVLEPIAQVEMEPLLPEAKEEETDRLVIIGGRITFADEEEVAVTSGVLDLPPYGEITNHEEPTIVLQNHLVFDATTEEVTPKLEEPDEFPIEIKEEETDRLVIREGRVVYEAEAGTSGVDEDLLPTPDMKFSTRLQSAEDVALSALALFAKDPQPSGAAPSGITGNAGLSDDQCSVCLTHFATRRDLYRHLCTPSGELQFPCDRCDAIYPLIDGLRAHLLVHGVENPYICDDCGKILKGEKCLEKHKMTHSGERPFVCELCGDGFFAKSGLQCHMQSQHGAKKKVKTPVNWFKFKFACDNCRYKTHRRALIKHHILHNHKEVLEEHKDKEIPEQAYSFRRREAKDVAVFGRRKSKEVRAGPGFHII